MRFGLEPNALEKDQHEYLIPETTCTRIIPVLTSSRLHYKCVLQHSHLLQDTTGKHVDSYLCELNLSSQKQQPIKYVSEYGLCLLRSAFKMGLEIVCCHATVVTVWEARRTASTLSKNCGLVVRCIL